MEENIMNDDNDIGQNKDLCWSCKGTHHIECPRCQGTGTTDKKATLRCLFCGGSGICQCPTCMGYNKKS